MQNENQRTVGETKTLVIEDRALAGGFVQLPRVVLRARNLTRDSKLLYAILLSYAWQAGQCFPGYKRLCQDMQAGETMVRQYMHELKVNRLVSWKRRGLNQTNIYVLLKLDNAHLVAEPSKTEVPEPRIPEHKEEPKGIDFSLRNSKVGTDEGQAQTAANPESPLHHASIPNVPRVRSGEFTTVGELIAARRQKESSERAQKPTEPPLQIRATIRQLTDEFGDGSHRASNVTRVARLFSSSQMDGSVFVSLLYEARAITKDRARDAIMRRPMAYYFSVLEDLLGLRGSVDAA
jgi:Helix-turn-helix domain